MFFADKVTTFKADKPATFKDVFGAVKASFEKFLETRAGRISYVAGLTLVLTALGFWAAVEIGSPTSTIAEAAMTDAPFARNAALGEIESVRFAHLAAEKTQSDVIREFAAEVEADHRQTSDGLNRAAFKKNISLPTELANRDQAVYDRLSALTGAQFDRAYMQEMVRDFQGDLTVYRREAAAGNDDLIRNYASKNIPLLEKNLDAAKHLSKILSAAESKPTAVSRAHRASR
jgi:putative membrane protein